MRIFAGIRKRLPEQVISLGWVSFFADICSELVYPVLPLFLMGALKVPPSLLGMIEGAAEATVSIMKGLSGYWSDRGLSRLGMVRWGYGLSALSKPLIGMASAWPLVLFARILDRFGKGIRTTPRDILLAESVDKEHLGEALGFHRSMDTAGALVGVLLGLSLLWMIPNNYRLLFLLAAIPGVLSLFATRKVVDSVSDKKEVKKLEFKKLFGAVGSGYWVALIASIMFAVANTSDVFLLMRAKELGLSDVAVIGTYACYNLTYMLSSYPLGRLSDRFGRWAMILPGWLIYGLVYWGFGVSNQSSLWFLFAIYGFAMGATKATGTSLILDHTPSIVKGTALGFFYLVTGFVTFGANAWVGNIYQNQGHQTAFWICAGAAWIGVMIAIVILLRFKQKLNFIAT